MLLLIAKLCASRPDSSVDNTANKNDLSPNETSNSFSSIQGSSSEAQSTTSNGEDSSSSSTATPEMHSSDEDKQANFGAIRRDRSRNPSWASFTTSKCNLSSKLLLMSDFNCFYD